LKFIIPQGTTNLYIAKGYPSDKLRENIPFDDLTLTSDKDILSYNGGTNPDVATLTAQLTSGGEPVAVEGETVTFEVRKQSDDSLVETLTDVTDVNGVATVGYTSKGEGDLYIKAECMFVSKRYEICDAIKYSPSDLNEDTILNLTLPNKYEISWNTVRTGNGGCFIRIGNENNNALAIGTVSTTGTSGLWEMLNGNWTQQKNNGTVSNGNHQYTITVDGTTVSFTLDSTTTSLTSTNVNLNNLLGYYVGTANAMKNFKVKPL